jgi:3-oxoacyl-[acyl-carrier protein] reductase
LQKCQKAFTYRTFTAERDRISPTRFAAGPVWAGAAFRLDLALLPPTICISNGETGMVAGRVALVTGAGSAGGIGFACAQAFRVAGARVAVTSTTARIHERAGELDGIGIVADLTDPAQATALVAEVEARMGPIEILVNNAGMVQTGRRVKRATVAGMPDAAWASHLDLNVTTAFHMSRAVLPGMIARGHGRIVNVSSVTGPMAGIVGSGGYMAGKAALCGLTRAVALENARHGITCNAVLPGWIATESSSAREMRAGRATPTGRSGTPDEVAACVVFLATVRAGYINGAMLVVDGGNSLMETKG